MRDPEISIIVASYNARTTIGAALSSLLNQRGEVPYEVIVVDSSGDGTAGLVARDYPDVRLIRSASRVFPGTARNRGVERAEGRILAFTDADCVAAPDFVETIHDVHRDGVPVIGGSIANGNPESAVGWAHYFAEFSRWMPQGAPRETEIPAGCLSMKRTVFEACGPFLEGSYCSDTAFYWRLRDAGHASRFEPRINVAHTNITSLTRLLRKQLFHGRSFARVRVRERRLSPERRALYVLASPLLPFVLFSRIVRRVFGRRAHRAAFLRTFPLVFIAVSAWSLGEVIGYIEA